MGDHTLIKKSVEQSRQELLNLSNRNQLINFKPPRKRSIEVVDELPNEVLRILCTEQKSMQFIPDIRPTRNNEEAAEESDEDQDTLEAYLASHQDERNEHGIAKRHVDNKLQTKLTAGALGTCLFNIYRFARSSIEEQGVNILYLSLGMLNWSDPKQKNFPRKSPILLIPVEINRAQAAKFTIRHNGDDVGCNLSLQAKLAEELGIDWPVLSADDDMSNGFDLNAYFKQCQAAIAAEDNCSVDGNAIYLGFFSFHEYVMYKDLDPDGWDDNTLGQNSALADLLGSDGFGKQAATIAATDSLDKVLDAKKLFQVVDADSSQTTVLAEAGSNKNMIVQGPPGTGKSQTIVNVIAQAVAENKTVLFVSEKLAALEVVKRRLDNNDLGSIALNLHSHKAQKKKLLEQLKEVLDSGEPVEDSNFEKHYLQLQNNKEKLNTHSQLIHDDIGDSGVSPFHIFGRLLYLNKELGDDRLPQLTMDGWENWHADKYDEVKRYADNLQVHLREIDGFAEHPFRDATATSMMPDDSNRVAKLATDAKHSLQVLQEQLKSVQSRLQVPDNLTLTELEALIKLLEKTKQGPPLSGLSAHAEHWHDSHRHITKVLQHVALIQKHLGALDNLLQHSAWENKHALELLNCLQNFRSRWWRWIYADYRAAASQVKSLWRSKQPSYKSRVQALEAIYETQQCRAQLHHHNDRMQQLYGDHWQQDASDVEHLNQVAELMKHFYDNGLRRELLDAVLQWLTKESPPTKRNGDEAELVDAVQHYQQILDELLKLLQINNQRYAPECNFKDYLLDAQSELLSAWCAAPEKLQPVLRFNNTQHEIENKGLGALVEVAYSWDKAATKLLMLLEKEWYKCLWRKHINDHPQLNQFSAGFANDWVKKFKHADQIMFAHNKARVLKRHHDNLPSQHGAGQMGILNKEFSKKSRHFPIRKLMHEAGAAIQKIKPVFMMSPFSVSSYLPRDRSQVQFDMVIFDEASQLQPVNAFGALMRGQQAIVVGDSKQLPPTRFFARMQDNELDDYEDASETMDVESILTMFEAKGAFNAMLRWHYRSRHNSLIEYSNHGFYGDKLVVFPAAGQAQAATGLHFVHLDESNSVYERGKGKNPKEAQYIATKVAEHIREHPQQTLGVATFSLPQAQEIEDRVEILRRENGELESFFNKHPDEPFFVKNLENVQGDERDVIFIGIGYGRDKEGRISMNFGPLNQDGGERRLNVLITRARSKCVIFSNIQDHDIDTRKTHAAGVRHLKKYLSFAEKKVLDTPTATGKEPDSPFEIEVAAAVRSLGWDVDYQVGSSGYNIDLAVKDPDKPGSYILAIECDGASYHSSRWARDRDRLRQSVLENLGWRFHRIWSQSWFNEEKTEVKKMQQAIESAKSEADRHDRQKRVVAKAKTKAVVRRLPPKLSADPWKTSAYQVAYIAKIKEEKFDMIQDSWLATQLLQVIRVEMPVHKKTAIRRVVAATLFKAVGKSMQRRFDAVIEHLIMQNKIRREGNFLRMPGATEIAVRNRQGVEGVSNNIEEVSEREIQAACLRYIMPNAISIGRANLYREILKILGMGSLSAKRKKYLAMVVDRLISKEVLAEKDGHIMIGKQAERGCDKPTR